MLFFLTSEKKQDMFDFLKEKYILNKDIKNEFNQETFLKYIKKEVRNIHMDYLIIDMNIFDSEEVKIQECLDSFFLLNPDSKIIILPALIEDTGELFGSIEPYDSLYILNDLDNPEPETIRILSNQEQTLIENDKTVNEMEEVIEDSNTEEKNTDTTADHIFIKATSPIKVSEGQPLNKNNKDIPDKVNQEDVAKPAEKQPNIMRLEEYIKTKSNPAGNWNCENVMIGVLGTERRTGTTTAAFQLVSYLQAQGARVAYMEANDHKHLQTIAEAYGFVKIEEHYIKGAITYYTDSQYDVNSGLNFIIIDLGCISENAERNIKYRDTMDRTILVSGSSPYDLEALDTAIDKLKDNNLNIIFNLANRKDLKDYKQKYRSETHLITYLKYCPDFSNTEKWEDEITDLFNEYCI